jgi:hypothetical protein
MRRVTRSWCRSSSPCPARRSTARSTPSPSAAWRCAGWPTWPPPTPWSRSLSTTTSRSLSTTTRTPTGVLCGGYELRHRPRAPGIGPRRASRGRAVGRALPPASRPATDRTGVGPGRQALVGLVGQADCRTAIVRAGTQGHPVRHVGAILACPLNVPLSRLTLMPRSGKRMSDPGGWSKMRESA